MSKVFSTIRRVVHDKPWLLAVAVLVLMSLVALVVVWCSRPSDVASPSSTVTSTTTTTSSTTTTTAPSTTTTTTVVPPKDVAPLTGLPGEIASRPALMIKIDNVSDARPQTSISKADIVFEEQVEGGLTRLAAVFQSQDPDTVGPVRSARQTDIHVASLLSHPYLVFSGAASPVLAALADVPDVLTTVTPSSAPNDFWRSTDKVIPHNMFTSTQKLWASVPAAAAPAPVFSYGPTCASTPASNMDLSFPAVHVSYTVDSASHSLLRRQDGSFQVDTLTGQPVAPTNVLVLGSTYHPSATNANSPEVDMSAGNAWLLTADGFCRGSYQVQDNKLVLAQPDGSAMLLTPGSTWVELAPNDPTFS